MSLRSLSRFGARLLSVVFLAGCARDAVSPVEPTAAVPSKPSAGLLSGLLQPVLGVKRTTALSKDISVSAVIGKAGGTITIADAGLTLVVPPGAVSSNTKFTATAVAGRMVAYEFEPHGTTFAVPLQFSQDLKKVTLVSTLTAPLLHGAYFTSRDNLNQTLGVATVTELLPAAVDLLKLRVSFPIKHFSGYLVSY